MNKKTLLFSKGKTMQRFLLPKFLYSLRSASMGFRFAALMEGSSPKTIPIPIENNTAATIAGMLMAVGVSETRDTIWDNTIPETTPRIPPMLVNTAASVRN